MQAAQLTEFKHFCSFHRFFSQARWNLDDLGRCVFQLLLPFCPEVVVAAVDDTLARKSGRHIWGAGMHHDPLRSTQKHPFFAFGHNFVVFSLQVALPFAPHKYWAFPGQSISRHLPANAKLISRMNLKAALYEPAGKVGKRGRPRKKGNRLPSPLQMGQKRYRQDRERLDEELHQRPRERCRVRALAGHRLDLDDVARSQTA
jgi:hypothetical protein